LNIYFEPKIKELFLKDVGSNVGIQARKLYEEPKFPQATFTQWYRAFFGPYSEERNKQGKNFHNNNN